MIVKGAFPSVRPTLRALVAEAIKKDRWVHWSIAPYAYFRSDGDLVPRFQRIALRRAGRRSIGVLTRWES